jgi:phosphoglycolate phosphatase-like HAD superfamily hydrolase
MVLARAAITRVLAHALKRKKPAPDQIWHILDSLRKDFASALVVGDTAIDQEVAAAASVPFVHARYGYGDLQRPASLWIESLNELEEVALEPAAVSCCMSE